MEHKTTGKGLKKAVVWKDLYFYRKSDTLYQLTVEFCRRFLPPHGDRTVDQMVQAARSGKQNIVEGSEDGQTSSEMELKLLNVARGSLQELREDYLDYLNTHHLPLWDAGTERQKKLRHYCSSHNDFADYAPLLIRMNDEEMANMAVTLCHQTDKMMCAYLGNLEENLIRGGAGIKERARTARSERRKEENAYFNALEEMNIKSNIENNELHQENRRLQSEIAALREELAALKARLGEEV